MDKSEREKLRDASEKSIKRNGLRADGSYAGEVMILATRLIALLDYIDALEGLLVRVDRAIDECWDINASMLHNDIKAAIASAQEGK